MELSITFTVMIVPGQQHNLALGVRDMLLFEFGEMVAIDIVREEEIVDFQYQPADFVIILSRYLRGGCTPLIEHISELSPQTSIIVSSADKSFSQETMAAGAHFFISKPFYVEDLLKGVYALMETTYNPA